MRESLRRHHLVATYLDRMCMSIRGERRKFEVREEILSHLEAALTESGMDPETLGAVEEVLARFGDPQTLGRNLRRAGSTWPETAARYMAACLTLCLLLIYLTSQHFIRGYERRLTELNSRLTAHFTRFEQEQKDLANLEVVRESSAVSADAGRYLNHRIRWEGQSAPPPKIDVPDIENPHWTRAWLKAPVPPELKDIDLTWMDDLKSFDHWDLFAYGPAADLVGKQAKPVNPYSVRIPNFSFVNRAARLRLRRGLDQKDVLSALREVHHLARLTYSTETMVGSMISVAMLKAEKAAYDEAVATGLIRPRDYAALEHSTLNKLRTVLWVTAAYADFSFPEQVRRAFLAGQWPAGSCAALAETAQTFALAGALLEKKYPFETDMSERMSAAKQVFAASTPYCRLTFHRQILSRHKEYANAILATNTVAETHSPDWNWEQVFQLYRYVLGQHIPFLRQTLGLDLIAIARPDFTRLYDHE